MTETPEAKKPRRVVKNPETFRERAIRAAESEESVKRPAQVKGLVSSGIIKPVIRPLGGLIKKLFSFPPLSWLKRPLRLLGLVLVPSYFRSSWRELKQVAWPSRRESLRLTWAVLAFAIVFGLTIALVDYGLDKVFRHLLLK